MRNDRGEVLHVRKRGTSMLMLPGGKPELTESFADTAVREFAEELGGALDPARLTPIGMFTTAAANEPGHEVVGHVFTHPQVPFTGPSAEIAELTWVDPSAMGSEVAPLSVEVLSKIL